MDTFTVIGSYCLSLMLLTTMKSIADKLKNKNKLVHIKDVLDKDLEVELENISNLTGEQSPYENSIIHLPIFNLSKKKGRKKEIKDIEFKNAKVTMSFLEGTPSSLGQNVFLYLISQIPRTFDENNKCILDVKKLRNKGMDFTIASICDGLNLDKSDYRQRQRIRQELECLANIGLSYKFISTVNIDGSDVTKKDFAWGNLFDLTLYEKNDRQDSFFMNNIRFNEMLLNSLNNKLYRLYSLKKFNSLASPVVRRLYIILGAHNFKKTWKIKTNRLKALIPIDGKNSRSLLFKSLQELLDSKIYRRHELYKNDQKEEVIVFYYR